MLALALLIGLVATALLWPLLKGALARNRAWNEEMIGRADDATRKQIEFFQPPKGPRTGRAAAVLQFLLVALLLSAVAWFVLASL